MANSKISALPSASTPLAGTELVPIVQGGITEQVSIDNLTAGKTVPTGKLQASSTGEVIRGTTSGDVTTTGTNFWRFYDSGGAKGYIGYGGSAGRFDVNSGSSCNMNINATNGTMELATGNVTRVTIENSGNATVVNGNFVIGTSGRGIDFSATPGTGTSELLADYEEGTWTPSQGSGLVVTGTFGSSGTYTKIGRMVFVTARITASVSMTCSGGFICSNLPFAIGASATGSLINSDTLGNSGSTLATPAASPSLYASAVSSPTGSITYSIAYPV